MVRLVVALGLFPFLSGIVTVVEPKERLSKRILFVVDVSGSMQGDKFAAACAAVNGAFQQPVDELEIAVLAFNDTTTRWKGIPEAGENPVPEGWAALPSQDAVEDASRFLAEVGADGDTLVIPALREALEEARSELSIVLVTDGIFQRETGDEVLTALQEGQAQRQERGQGPALLMVYGVGSESEVLSRLAREGKGGYMRETLPSIDPAAIR